MTMVVAVTTNAKEKTEYHADPEVDVARRAENSSPTALHFVYSPTIHHPSSPTPTPSRPSFPPVLKDALARVPETFAYKPRRKDG